MMPSFPALMTFLSGTDQRPVKSSDPLPATLTDGVSVVEVDPYVDSLVVIDVQHRQTHKGQFFEAGHRWTGQADDANLYLSITVPTGYVAHTIYEVSATATAYIDLYEGASISGGTEITPANKNRRSSNTANVTIKRDVTVSDTGTLLPQSVLVAAGEKGKASGGGSGLDNEWIFDENTTYLLKVQNKGGAGQDVSATLSWYERTVS